MWSFFEEHFGRVLSSQNVSAVCAAMVDIMVGDCIVVVDDGGGVGVVVVVVGELF